jgi:glycosyltransferase involved in cell wall biosynthesis
MKIGFDAKRALLNHSGLGNYSRTLIKAFYTCYPENQYYLFTPKTGENYLEELSVSQSEIISPSSFLDKNFHSYWRSYKLASTSKNLELDIYHGLSHELPIGIERTGIKTVVTIHDLIFERFPDHYPYIDRITYKKKIQYACNIADSIVAISEQTKQDLVDFYKIDEAKIKVIYQGCENIFKEAIDEKHDYFVKNRYNLPEKYLLHVGSYNKRKNHINLLEAYKLIKDQSDIKLVLVGSGGSQEQAIRQYIHKNNLINNVVLIQKVNNKDLSYIYKNAEALVYNSLFEGFGIPILEAFSSGIPVITSTGSCFEEVGGDACIYVDALDYKALAQNILELMQDDTKKQELINKGFSRSKIYSNEHIANEYMSIFLSLLNTHNESDNTKSV